MNPKWVVVHWLSIALAVLAWGALGVGVVSVIATASNKVVATIPVASAYGVAITPHGRFVYVGGVGVVSVMRFGNASRNCCDMLRPPVR